MKTTELVRRGYLNAKSGKNLASDKLRRIEKNQRMAEAKRKQAEADRDDMAEECASRGIRIRRDERTIDALTKAKPHGPKLPPRDYTKRPPTMKHWEIAETLMGGMIRKKPGITPYAIQRAMPAEWMKHPDLKVVRRPADSTFRDIAREMKANGKIRRAHPKKDRIRI